MIFIKDLMSLGDISPYIPYSFSFTFLRACIEKIIRTITLQSHPDTLTSPINLVTRVFYYRSIS